MISVLSREIIAGDKKTKTTKKHFRRRLEVEFKDLPLQYEDFNHNGDLALYYFK